MEQSRQAVLVYDGQCRFCVGQATRLGRWVGTGLRLESFREPGVVARYPGLTEETCAGALQLILPDGRRRSGAAAIAGALRLRPALAPLGWLYELPGLRPLIDAGYRVVARNRFRLGGAACAGDACRVHDGR
jgi:predicted DCC family thiol-disulfide oxidoreductase YuxK